MSKRPLVSLKDVKADSFGVIHSFSHLATALREFEDLCKDESSVINKHPEDFELWQIGLFDEDACTITADIRVLATAKSILEVNK